MSWKVHPDLINRLILPNLNDLLSNAVGRSCTPGNGLFNKKKLFMSLAITTERNNILGVVTRLLVCQ